MPAPRYVLLAALFACACTSPNPDFCDSNEDCAGSARSFCDISGDIEGTANTCIRPPATEPDAGPPTPDAGPACAPADTFLRCDSDRAITCSATSTEVAETCSFGCNESAERCNECTPDTTVCTADQLTLCDADGAATRSPCALGCHGTEVRCNKMLPSNGLGSHLELAEGGENITLTDGAVIDTDTGNVLNGDASSVLVPSFEVLAPVDGVPIRVFIASRFELGSVSVTGTQALALVASDEVILTGELDLGAAGALTAAPCVGGAGVVDLGDPQHLTGNGGGGSRSPGGRGGNIGSTVNGGAGGAAFSNADLDPLRGGCRGGGNDFGRGGGAVQIVAGRSIDISEGAIIDASGKGGTFDDPTGAWGGGGSGGGILLESPSLTLGPGVIIAANGGGGACGNMSVDAFGEDGRRTTNPAAGGECGVLDGGRGGTGTVPPTNGVDAPSAAVNAATGSGGGAAGYVRFNTRTGAFDSSSDAVSSPEATTAVIPVQ